MTTQNDSTEELAEALYRTTDLNLPLSDSLDIDCHDVARAVLASDWLAGVKAEAGRAALRDAVDEIKAMLDRFPQQGRHTRARWAVEWLRLIIERNYDETSPA